MTGVNFEEVFRDIELFILQSKPYIANKYIEIRKGSTNRCFYKGVVVKDDMGQCLYTYNILRKIDLTEDRTAKYAFEIRREIVNGIITLTDKNILKSIICADEMGYEGRLDYDSYITPSDEFLEVCKHLAETHDHTANKQAIDYALKYIEANTLPEEYELSALENSMYQKSCELLGLVGFNVMKYPVKFVTSLGTGVYAQAKEGTMYLAKPCFDEGTKTVAHALLEEMFHLEHGFKDETRQFQTFLFKNILNLTERLNQEAF